MEKTAEKLKVNESLLKTVLCSATFWGLLAHGMVLFNKYSFHDDGKWYDYDFVHCSNRISAGR